MSSQVSWSCDWSRNSRVCFESQFFFALCRWRDSGVLWAFIVTYNMLERVALEKINFIYLFKFKNLFWRLYVYGISSSSTTSHNCHKLWKQIHYFRAIVSWYLHRNDFCFEWALNTASNTIAISSCYLRWRYL